MYVKDKAERFMSNKRDCTTCEKRTVIDYYRKIAHCDAGKDKADGYPYIGEDCEYYSRVPGSDDDLIHNCTVY